MHDIFVPVLELHLQKLFPIDNQIIPNTAPQPETETVLVTNSVRQTINCLTEYKIFNKQNISS